MSEDDTRLKVKSPNAETHQRVRGIVQKDGGLVLDNPRRLSLSVRNPSAALVEKLEQEGAIVSEDFRYDMETPGG
jgi:hypothetical protein